MSFPTEAVPVPDVVAELAGGRETTAVWVNELGGVTFSVAAEEFVKVYPAEHAALLVAERARLTWAIEFHPVPRVLASGPGWMQTAAVPGRSAVDPHWVARPAVAARAIGSGLRLLHDALPVGDCPFEAPTWIPDDAPAADRLVVCHGDACAPNTLIADDGTCAGHVDLGDLGVADRWSDLAIASRSLSWNYPGSWEHDLFDAYGVAPDRDRIAYYRLRWDEWPTPDR